MWAVTAAQAHEVPLIALVQTVTSYEGGKKDFQKFTFYD